MNYRLYTFVAHHYLSPLQCGIQTAHVVSEMSLTSDEWSGPQGEVYRNWAGLDKTIIVCGAGNHEGVITCYNVLAELAPSLDLPFTLFQEDERSMNRMATACGVIVPEEYYSAEFEKEEGVWLYTEQDNGVIRYHRHSLDTPEGQLIQHIKRYRLV